MKTPDYLKYRNSGFYFIALLTLAITAFWEPYFSHVLGNFSSYTADISNYKHFHVIMSVSWLAMLITQPILIRSNRRSLHRSLGKLSYLLAPLVVVSIVLLAHSQIVTLAEQSDARRHFILFIQLGFALFFALLLALLVSDRRQNTGGRVFQSALSVFVVFQPAHLTTTATPAWTSFSAWFAALPLT